MYAHFYQLSESPFNLTPDPKFHYVNESTREAIASLLHGIKSRKGFITLIAEAGTGKTTLLRRIVEELEGESQVVFVFNPGVSFEELLEFICTELGLDTRGCKRLHLIDRLNSHLLEQLTAGRNVVVMIDEAQTLEDSVLEELRLLSNLETSKEKILQIVLSGQPELEEKLRRPQLRQLRQRIGVRTTLKPVQPAEMQAYVETRLRAAGASRNDLFTPAALKRVWQASGGIPRVINVICDNAMMIAFADGQRRITPKTLREAMRDLGADLGLTDSGRGAWRTWAPRAGYAALAAALIAAAIPAADLVVERFGEPAGPPIAVAEEARIQARAEVGSLPRSPARESEASEATPSGLESQGARAATARAADAAAAQGAPRVEIDVSGEDAEAAHTRRALESDATQRQPILDSIRRAEIVARSTAARLYDRDRGGAGDGRKDLAAAALDEVARDRGLTGLGEPDDSVAAEDEAIATAALEAEETVEGAEAPVVAEPVVRDTEAVKAGDSATAVEPEVDASIPAPAPPAPVVGEPAAVKRVQATVAAATKSKEPVASASAESARRAKGDAPPAAAASPRGSRDSLGTVVVAGQRPASPEPATPVEMPSLGRSVVVKDGDTVWDISIRHYGEAGPTVLKRILAANARIRDPLKLEVGSTVFLPFSRPEQMVSRDSTGFRVLLASGPDLATVAPVETWARTFAGDVRVTRSASQHEVYVVGLASESAAVGLATGLLERSPGTTAAQRTAMR